MNEVHILSISKTDFRNILQTSTRFFTFMQTGSSKKFDLIKIEEYLKDVEFPDEIPSGGHFIIDYPMKYPIYADILPFNNIYELFSQIKDIIETVYSLKKEFMVPDYIKISSLYIDKLTCCKSGDIVVYIKSY